MSGKSKVPSTPTYQAPAPYTVQSPYQSSTYTSPGNFTATPYQTPTNPNKSVSQVQTPQQIMQNGAAVENTLPSWLQLNSAPLSQQAIGQYQNNYYAQNEQPALQNLQSDSYNNGQSYGSYAGGAYGSALNSANLDSYNAALNYGQQLYNDQISGRQSYFSGGPTIATNQNNADVARSLAVANLQTEQTNALNNFNLSQNSALNSWNQSNASNQTQNSQYNATGQNAYNENVATGINAYNTGTATAANNFGVNNYQNQLAQYQQKQQNSANIMGSAAQVATNLFGAGIGIP